jgi:vancomycin resistance protein YoaR
MWQRLGFLVGSAGLLILVTIAAYELNFDQKIIPRVFVNNFELSGMTKDEARFFLENKYKEGKSEIELLEENRTQKVNLSDLGVVYAFEKTVDDAFVVGRNKDVLGNYLEKFKTIEKGRRVDVVFSYDLVAVEVLVASVAAEVNNKPIQPKLVVNRNKEIEFVQGKNGEEVDEGELKSRILDSIKDVDLKEIKVPTKRIMVEKTDDEVTGLKERAYELLQRELILEADSYSKKIGGNDLVNLIGFEEKWRTSEIKKIATKVALELNREAQDARFEFKNERLADFSVDVDGIEVIEEDLMGEIVRSLEMNQEKIEIPINKTMAKVRAGEINNLGIVGLLSRGTSTYFHSIPGRVHNVSLAAARINGVMVPPGEEFSFNKTLGDISAATGYKSAYIIKDGRTVLGDGGGVCQVSTTLFRAALNAGLPITERHPHAYRVSYYEQDSKPGLDATVYDPSADLRFKNDTDKYILIQTKADPAKYRLEIEIYGTSDGRIATVTTPKIFSTTPPPEDLYIDDPTLPKGSVKQIDWKAAGARVVFDYLIERNGEVIFKKTFYSNYQPWQAVYLRGVIFLIS